MPAPIRQGVTEEMILKAFAINLQRCAVDGARYVKYTFRDITGSPSGAASLECLDAELEVIHDARSQVELRSCFDPLEKCAEQQRLFDMREGNAAWNKLSVILDLSNGKFTRKKEMIDESVH